MGCGASKLADQVQPAAEVVATVVLPQRLEGDAEMAAAWVGIQGSAQQLRAKHAGLCASGRSPNMPACAVGVSLEYLLAFAQHMPAGVDSGSVMQRLINPGTASHGCRWADMEPLLPGCCMGPPTIFISHCWCNQFGLLVQAAERHLLGAVTSDVYVWLDLFAMNQHASGESGGDLGDLMGNLERAVRDTEGTIVVMDPTGGPLVRVWCLLEVWTTLKLKGTAALHIVNPPDSSREQITRASREIDLANARATVASDKTMILGWIADSAELAAGALPADTPAEQKIKWLSGTLKLHFLLTPLDFTADLRLLLQPSAGHTAAAGTVATAVPCFRFDAYTTWVKLSEKEPGHRCLLVQGVQGSGKSTFAAALCGHSSESVVQPQAHFFCTRLDREKASGLRMVLTLACQLAQRFLHVQTSVLAALEGNMQSLEKVEDAFEVLLKAPLAGLPPDQIPPEGVIILVEAITEAQPATSQMAYDNKVLQVLRELAPSLPPFVRFVITTRPVPVVTRILQLALSPQEVSMDELQQPSHLHSLLVTQLRGMVTDGQTVGDASLDAAAHTIMAKAGGNLTYPKLVLQGGLMGTGGMQLAQVLAALPGGAEEAYTALFSGARSKAGEAWQQVMCLLEVLAAAPTPLALNFLSDLGLLPALDVLRTLDFFRTVDFKLRPTHNAVLEFVRAPGPFHADAGKGHAQLARLSVPDARCAKAQPYSLCYAVMHAVQAGEVESLHGLLLDFEFWGRCFEAGVGLAVLADLQEFVASGNATSVARDVARWLKTVGVYLTKHPEGTLQLACDAPRNSLVAKHAASLPLKPPTTLLTKEDNWPAFLITLRGHESNVNSVAISPDGKTIMSGSDDNTIRIWNRESGEWKSTLQGHTDRVASVAISPDGNTIVSGSWDKTIRVWDFESGECKSTLEGHTDRVGSVAISPDGKTIVSGSADKTIRVWDLGLGVCKSTLQGHTKSVSSVAISPSFQARMTIVSGSDDKTIRVWDLEAGKCWLTLEGHTQAVTSVAISPDGKTIVSGSLDDTIRVWDLESEKCKRRLEGPRTSVNSVAISPDGKTIVSGSADNAIRVWDLESGKCKSTLQGHTDMVCSVAITPDGKAIVSGSYDETIRVWDLELGERKSMMQGHTEQVNSVAISPDGKTIVSGSEDQTIRVWDLESAECKSTLQGHTSEVFALSISPDGKTIVSGSQDKTIRVWDLRTGECQGTLQGHTDMVLCVAISPDGQTIVSGSVDNTIRAWNLRSGECQGTLKGHTDMVASVTISPSGKTIVSGSSDNTIRVWDLESGECKSTLQGHEGTPVSVAISADGKTIVSGSWDRTCRVWDLETAQQLSVSTLEQAAQAWSRGDDQVIAVIGEEAGGLVDILKTGPASHVLSRVHVTPPFRLEDLQACISMETKRLAFKYGNHVLVYQLNL